MINRLSPVGVCLNFCAKKAAPGEISRVKSAEDVNQNQLVRTPKSDTFTASASLDNKSNIASEQLPQNEYDRQNKKSNQKGNA